MPPKRTRKAEVVSSDSTLERPASMMPIYVHPADAGHATFFDGLTSDQVLSLIVGVATRLSARVAALQHSSAPGNARVFRDCIRVTHSALSFVGPAIIDLVELEMVLQRSLSDLITGLAEVTTPSRRRRI
jgi:hypothetical protein